MLVRLLKLVLLYLLAASTGWIFRKIGIPLPWMIGPLVFSAILYISGKAQAPVPVQTRPFGQMVVASSVGIYFTPVVLQKVFELSPLLVGMALITAFSAIVVAIFLSRITDVGLTQAILSTFPTSPVEAAVMAEKFGFNPSPVVLSQTLRIAAIVILIPISIYSIDGWPDRPVSIAKSSEIGSMLGILVLAAAAISGGAFFRLIKMPNPYFLGPLAFTSILSALEFKLTPYPGIVLALAQIVLGTWLGSTFRRELFQKTGQLVTVSMMTTLLLLLISSFTAVIVAEIFGLSWETLVLGAAPGGVTEMALTAKYLGKDVALITAFQLTRIFIFMPNIPWLIRLVNRWEARRSRRID
jgi:uncharacterized protein